MQGVESHADLKTRFRLTKTVVLAIAPEDHIAFARSRAWASQRGLARAFPVPTEREPNSREPSFQQYRVDRQDLGGKCKRPDWPTHPHLEGLSTKLQGEACAFSSTLWPQGSSTGLTLHSLRQHWW